jgi:hypothetical protein
LDGTTGDIIAHTQSNDINAGAGEFSVKFTAPFTGTATISGLLWDAHTTVDRDQAWSLKVNAVQLDSGVVVGDGTNGSASPDTFGLAPLLLLAGQTVVLDIVRTAGGTELNGGLVGLNINIDLAPSAAVPLPGALPLFASVIGAFFGLQRWRRRRQAAAA